MTGPAPFEITLFGPMEARVQGQPLPRLRSRKALWLLALLTLRHDRPVERAWLAGTLWPDVDLTRGFANLRPTVSELRNALGEERERLQSPTRDTLRLDLEGAEADVPVFDAAIAGGRRPDLERAVALYRGPLLEGCVEEWVGQEREWCAQSCLRALQQLGDAAQAEGGYDAASGFYQRALAIDPFEESARRGLMEALARAGNANGALQVYRALIELLREDPQAGPDAETRALYERLRSASRRRASQLYPVSAPAIPDAPAAPVTAISGHLPHPVTELIGREDERADVAERLRRARLVTLTGLGGIGKTRLALAVVADVATEYGDGVGLVALDVLAHGGLVASQIASTLGLREEVGRSPLQSVTEHLKRKRLLLVLDNCEHLLQAVAEVAARLLHDCAGVRILATSREALGILGETAWTVPQLAVPDLAHLPPGRTTLLRVLMGYEGVRLFVERAQAAQSNFELTAANAPAVARVCSQLDGIPLALELVAARVRAMTLEQIATRLHGHPMLMMSGSRAAPTRQQTLRATMEWSYALLTEPERLLFQRLAVFAGGWTLEAAEEICSDSGSSMLDFGLGEGASASPDAAAPPAIQNPKSKIQNPEVLDLLTSLVDRSLIAFEVRESEAGGRYRLLEIVRQYAAERLQASGEIDRVKARHRDWLMALAEEAEPRLTGAEQHVWLRRLEAEHDNLRATLAWGGAAAEGAAPDLRLAGALYRFWYVRGHLSEGREHLGRALAQPAAQERTQRRAQALHAAGTLAYSQTDYGAARTLNEESLSIRRELGDMSGVAASLYCLGNVAYDQGAYAEARSLHEESLRLRRELGDREGIAWSLNSLGNLAHPRGEFAAARGYYEECWRLFRELGDRQGTARSLACVGYVTLDQGEPETARSQFEESERLFRELEDRGGTAWSLCCLGYAAFVQGEYDAARIPLEEGRSLFQELGDRRGVAWALNCLGDVAYQEGDYAGARAMHEETLRVRRELGDRQGIAWSLCSLGRAAHALGASAAAQEILRESLGLFRALSDPKGVADCLGGLAGIMLAQGEAAPAVRLWGAVDALRRRIGMPLSPCRREPHARAIAQARMTLGEAAFGAAWEAGHALTWEQATDEALEAVGDRELRPAAG